MGCGLGSCRQANANGIQNIHPYIIMHHLFSIDVQVGSSGQVDLTRKERSTKAQTKSGSRMLTNASIKS